MITTLAEPLSISAFSKFGSIVSPDEEVAGLDEKAKSANQGTAIKLLRVSKNENAFPDSAGVRVANWNLFRCFAQPHLKRSFVDTPTATTVEHPIKVLEKHPYSTQTFVPMGRDQRDVAYVVVVALEGADGGPDLSTLKAFTCKGNQAVTYGAGVWHAPMIVLGEQDFLDFSVLIHELLDPKKPEMDCVERIYKEGDVTISLHSK